jgi:hypothetical protein
MGRENSPLGYIVALFDILGFEFRLKKYGLDEILYRYQKIVDLVKNNEEKNKILFDKLQIVGPLLIKDGPPAVFYDIKAIYSSDSILVWSNLAWEMAQSQPIELLKKNENHPAFGYFSKPVPLEPFLTICAEIICKSIEFDLPLRGAIAMGDAVLNEHEGIFLGDPIVDAARLERGQNCIGASICNSFMEQEDHKRFFLPYTKQFKEDFKETRKESALNWPLFWNNSRKNMDLKTTIEKLAYQNNNHQYYANTIEFIRYSDSYKY